MSQTQEPVQQSTWKQVVEAVADAEDADPMALDPLYSAVDPEAFDRLNRSDTTERIEFSYHGYDVVVDGERVRLRNEE